MFRRVEGERFALPRECPPEFTPSAKLAGTPIRRKVRAEDGAPGARAKWTPKMGDPGRRYVPLRLLCLVTGGWFSMGGGCGGWVFEVVADEGYGVGGAFFHEPVARVRDYGFADVDGDVAHDDGFGRAKGFFSADG